VGFSEGESNFYCRIGIGTTKSGSVVQLNFNIVQSIRDSNLISKFIPLFKGGNIYTVKDKYIRYVLSNNSDINNHLIPFFKQYPLQGKKLKDFNNFCKIADLMNKNLHLTTEGIKKIREIKNLMNVGFVQRKRLYEEKKENVEIGTLSDKKKRMTCSKKKEGLDSIYVFEGGEANNRSGEGVRLAIKQSEIHKDYLFFLYSFFVIRGYCSNLTPRKYLRKIKGKNKIYYGYEFNTFTFRSFV